MNRALHKLVSSTGEPAYAVDRRGEIVAWNGAATSAFGYPPVQTLGRQCWQLLRGQDVFGNAYCGRYCPHRAMAARRQPIRRCQLKLATATGERKGFTVSTLCLFDQPGDEILVHLCRPCVDDGELITWSQQHSSSFRSDPNSGVLTDRETEVLRALADGRSTREIATLLSISIATVRNHVQHVLDKLNCHSRLEAVTTARRLQLI